MIVAYVLVGSTISIAETVTDAQNAAAQQNEARLRTGFSIDEAMADGPDFNCTINNTGSEIISDFRYMDVIVYDSDTRDYQLYPYDAYGGSGTWTIVDRGSDIIHPNELDPGETYRIEVMTDGTAPYWFQITTANGVSASRFL